MSIRLDGESKAVEYNAVGAMKDAVRVVFRGPRVVDLFDRDWHKMALSIQAQNVSLYVDCMLVQTLPIEERENIDIQGKTVIGKRLYDSVPIDVSTRGLPPPRPRGRQGGSTGVMCPGVPPPAGVIYQCVTWTVLEGRSLTQRMAILEPRVSITPSFNYSAIQSITITCILRT